MISMKMTRRETLSAALILPGMLLLCTDQLPAAIAGVALLGAGAGALNWVEIRAKLRKIGSQRTRGATRSRQPKPGEGMSAAASCPPAVTRAKKKAARRPERQSKKDTPIFYPKKQEKSRHRTTI